MAKESQPLLYTTRAEIESILSGLGVDLMVDDDESGDIDASEEEDVTEAIWEATDIINERASHFYDAEALETSSWVRRRASYLAAHILGRRRGNPSVYCEEVEEIRAELKRLGRGDLWIPRIQTRHEHRPTMSNLVVDRNYTKSKIRVDKQTSVGEDDSVQDKDYFGERSGYYGW